ncbi:MAG TPA: hypothetical protein VIY48_00025 [Candidatus Paceibacterota bacterium]
MCANKDCGIHFRQSQELKDDYGFRKVSYHDEWAVYTDTNAFSDIFALFGKGEVPHMTLLIKVGKGGTVGDLIEKDPEGVRGYVYDGEFSTTEEHARNANDMFLYGVQSGVLVPEKPVSPGQLVMKYVL